MNWVKTLSRVLERMEGRKKNTEKAREDLATIMESLSDIIPDKVSGYNSDKEFHVKASWWVNNWVYFDDKCRFGVIDGEVSIIDKYGEEICDYANFHDVVDYINFGEMVPALIDFIEKLSEINVWGEEVKALESIKKALSSSSK